jgi:hypothetical protein
MSCGGGSKRLRWKSAYADHADVVRPSGARGIRIVDLGEVERRSALQALAPALHVERIPRRKHIAALPQIGGLAADDVDSIDRHHREQVLAAAVAHGDLVFVAGLADDPRAPFVIVDRQAPAFAAVVNADVGEASRSTRLCGRCGKNTGENQFPELHVEPFPRTAPWRPHST